MQATALWNAALAPLQNLQQVNSSECTILNFSVFSVENKTIIELNFYLEKHSMHHGPLQWYIDSSRRREEGVLNKVESIDFRRLKRLLDIFKKRRCLANLPSTILVAKYTIIIADLLVAKDTIADVLLVTRVCYYT